MPVEPAKTEVKEGEHIAFYRATDVGSLKDLELSAERDEANWIANIKKMELATEDGEDGTAITYADVANFKMGHLTLVSYSSDEDKKKLKAQHENDGETFLIDGEANVATAVNVVKLMVFREKPKPKK
jgi:ActR/RegA family two-component response regulator